MLLPVISVDNAFNMMWRLPMRYDDFDRVDPQRRGLRSCPMEVYWHLGTGFLEPVYQEALEIELQNRHIPYESQKHLVVLYKDQPLKKDYVADLVCYGQIIVELKALNQLSGKDVAQLLNYLKATGLRVGLLFNFGSRGKLEWKRMVI